MVTEQRVDREKLVEEQLAALRQQQVSIPFFFLLIQSILCLESLQYARSNNFVLSLAGLIAGWQASGWCLFLIKSCPVSALVCHVHPAPANFFLV